MGAHSHTHRHGHGHDHHGHSHGPADYGRRFALGVILNTGFVVVEAAAGLWSGSIALVADAGHNLSDVLGLAIAWGAHVASARPPRGGYTYGYKSSSILAALANATLLMVTVGAILIETVRRFADPQGVEPGTMMVVAGIGIAINTGTAMLFFTGRGDDINIRGAYLHMAADAAVSAGVVIAGLLIAWTGAAWIDPVTSLAIVLVIAIGTWGLLKDSMRMGLHGVPPGIDERAVFDFLGMRGGVAAVHHLHIWPMSTTETALTAHLVMPGGHPGDRWLRDLADGLRHEFGIAHPTIQVELGTDAAREARANCGG